MLPSVRHLRTLRSEMRYTDIHHTERRKQLRVDKLLISTCGRTDIDSVAVLRYVHVVAEILNVSRCMDVYFAFVVLL